MIERVMAREPGKPWSPSPDSFKILRLSTDDTLNDAVLEATLEERCFSIYTIPSVVRLRDSVYEAVVDKDAIEELKKYFTVDECSRPWEPSESLVGVHGTCAARRAEWIRFVRRVQQCRVEAHRVYRARVEELEPDLLSEFDFVMMNHQESMKPFFWVALVDAEICKL